MRTSQEVVDRLTRLGVSPERHDFVLKKLGLPPLREAPKALAEGGDPEDAPDVQKNPTVQINVGQPPGSAPAAPSVETASIGMPTAATPAAGTPGFRPPPGDNPFNASGFSESDVMTPSRPAPSAPAAPGGPGRVDPSQVALPPPSATPASLSVTGTPGPTGGGIGAGIPGAIQTAQEAEKQYGAAREQATGMEADVAAQEQARFQQNEFRRQQALTQAKQTWDSAQSDMRNYKYEDFWASKSMGSRIGAALAVAFGGIGQALAHQGSNAALGVIEMAMNRDLEQQKLKYERLKDTALSSQSMYGQLLNTFQDQRLADIAYKNGQIEQAKTKAVQMLAPADAAKAQAALGVQQEQLKLEAAKIETERYNRQAMLTLQYQQRAVPWQGEQKFAPSDEEAKAGRVIVEAHDKMQQGIRDLLQQSGSGRALPGTERAATTEQLVSFLQDNYRQLMQQGVFKPAEVAFISSFISNPAKWDTLNPDAKRKNLQQLSRLITRGVNDKFASWGQGPTQPGGGGSNPSKVRGFQPVAGK